MQNKNFTLDGSGKATIVSPCPCEAVDLYIAGATPHTFTFQYAARADEVAQPEQAGKGVGDAISRLSGPRITSSSKQNQHGSSPGIPAM